MNRFKRLLSVLLALTLVFSMAACGGNTDTTESTETTGENAANTTYTVSLKTAGGMVMSGVDVYVYADSTLADMKQYGQTDENGTVTFQMPESGSYAIAISGAPDGYQVEESYSFNGTGANITLTSALIQGESLSGATLGLGDVMYDFDVVTPEGETVTLSEVLSEKKMVLLNFWFSTCGPCANEFPYMEEAYQLFKDSVGVIAVDPLEDTSVVGGYQSSMGLTFPMAACPAAWSTTFGISGYPTSIIIDRYGVICLIEVGGLTSLRPFTSIFETFTAEDYEQKLYNSVDELITNVKPTFEMDTSENIAALINSGDIEVTYRPETDEDSAEYAWPFIEAEKNGEKCLKASNQEIEGSFAILYADVTLKAGQALGFDFLRSTEANADVMYVIVNGDDINAISGAPDPEKWESCYPVVAEEDGVYEVALCYVKDDSTNVGDDTVYIKNMRVVNEADIDSATYLPRQAATPVDDGFAYDYVDIVFNEADGYYHVGTADGPLLLADLMNYTQFNEETTLWEMAYNGDIVLDGHDYMEELEGYCNYASNSQLNGICTVNQELYDLLQVVDKTVGFDDEDDMEWLKLCKYFQAYGTDGGQLEDPIAGLAPFSAYTATEGKNVESNYFYYNRIIMPRGMLAEFVPSRSGVYRITSRTDYQDGLDAWIFNENHEAMYTYEQDERLFNDNQNVSMVYYMEAGEKYYIDIAFWDVYATGYIYYDIEYMGASTELFRLCAPGYFTYDSDATGEAMYHLISGGIDVILGDDGYYYEDLGMDANGKQKYGSKIYADFTGLTALFSKPIATVDSYDEEGNLIKDENGESVKIKGMIEMGGFDFSKTEGDLYILSFLEARNNNVEETDKYLHELWGDTYEEYAEIYQVKDVYEGIYHGTGENLTAEMEGYLDKIITSGSKELIGCVPVDARLAELLTMLMEKYTFENVDDSWIKLCYYYDYLGPEG